MSIVITGGAGFIGSHLVQFLLDTTDEDLIILDRLDETSTLKRLDKSNGRIHFYLRDLKHPINNSFRALSKKTDPIHSVYHLAASSHVTRSIQDPLLFIKDNVVGTCNLLDSIRDTDVKLIYISTDEVFGDTIDPYYGFKEHDPHAPTNPYSATKASAENLVRAYAATYEIDAKIIRLTNVIGIKQHPEKFIPLVIKSLIEGKPIYIHTNRTGKKVSTRYYLDVRDVVSGIVLINNRHIPSLSKVERTQGVYHLSGNREILNSNVANLIAKYMHVSANIKYISQDNNRPNHDLNYRLDDSYTRSETGWYPIYTFEDTLIQITRWYLDNPEWLRYEFYKS